MDWQNIFNFLGTIGGLAVLIKIIFEKFLGFNLDVKKSRIDREEMARHQIAQQAYNSFFSSKMDTYIKLAQMKIAYEKSIDEFLPLSDGQDLEINYDRIHVMLEIRNQILNNSIYLSDKLIEAFNQWDKKFTPAKMEAEYDRFQRWNYFLSMAEVTGESANALVDEERNADFQNFMDANKTLWDKVLEQIDNDIKALKKRYDL